MEKISLVFVDSTTKLVEVEMVEKATSEKAIEIFRKVSLIHGLHKE